MPAGRAGKAPAVVGTGQWSSYTSTEEGVGARPAPCDTSAVMGAGAGPAQPNAQFQPSLTDQWPQYVPTQVTVYQYQQPPSGQWTAYHPTQFPPSQTGPWTHYDVLD